MSILAEDTLGAGTAPSWCRNVIWTDATVLTLKGLAAIPGSLRILSTSTALGFLGALLVWLEVVLGLLAASRLLTRRSGALRLAYLAASTAIVGGLFTLAFVDVGAGISRNSWAYSHRSTLKISFWACGVGWNLLYLIAARILESLASARRSTT